MFYYHCSHLQDGLPRHQRTVRSAGRVQVNLSFYYAIWPTSHGSVSESRTNRLTSAKHKRRPCPIIVGRAWSVCTWLYYNTYKLSLNGREKGGGRRRERWRHDWSDTPFCTSWEKRKIRSTCLWCIVCFFFLCVCPSVSGAGPDGKESFATNACRIRAVSTATAMAPRGNASARRIGAASSATKVVDTLTVK